MVISPARVTPTKRRLAWSPDAGQRTESPWSSPEAERLAAAPRGMALLREPGAPRREAGRAASRTSDAETRRARRHAAPAAKDAAADQTRRRADKGTRKWLGAPRLAPRADRRPAPAAVAAALA